jgi:hypothetical protein
MSATGNVELAGRLRARVMRAERPPVAWRVRNAIRPGFWLGWLAVMMARLFSRVTGIPVLTSELRARLRRADGSVVDCGVLGRRVVTTAFVNFMVDQLQTETSVWGDFKYHDCGTGVGAEAVGDVGLGTPYGGARATGTQAEGAANVYVSVGTISFTSTLAITEHGLFSAATSVTLMDRTVFSAINVVSGDSIQFTYTLTISAGG